MDFRPLCHGNWQVTQTTQKLERLLSKQAKKSPQKCEITGQFTKVTKYVRLIGKDLDYPLESYRSSSRANGAL